ncbi:MAG: PspC domain-containing protein [Sphaerochaetaceae bacterium]|nr:PspC domain-containing protein [Sphaerochaetaceae bacterium]
MDYYGDYEMDDSPRRRFRRSKRGMIFGVCKGISNYFSIDVKFVRLLAILALVFSKFAPIAIIYLLIAIFIPAEK